MVTVDSKGRIVLPQDLRECLGISPGTEVEIRKEDGKAVVKPEEDPDQIIERMNHLIEETSANRDVTSVSSEEMHPLARNHAEIIRQGAANAERSDE